jgi:low temperature requirement protein LtrA
MQVGRSLFALWAFERAGRRADAKNFQRIIIWLSVSALFWICGGLAAPAPRLGLWAVALAIEYTGLPSASLCRGSGDQRRLTGP